MNVAAPDNLARSLRVLLISTDRKLFETGSITRQRISDYGTIFQELHVIVFSTTAHGIGDDPQKIAENVWAYPTNSRSRWLYLFDAYQLAKKQFLFGFGSHINVASSQDPFETGLAGFLIARKFQIPLHVQIHTDLLDPYFVRRSALNRVRKWIARVILPHASCVRVVSERAKEQLERKYESLRGRIAVLPIRTNIHAIRQSPAAFDLHAQYPGYKFIVLMVSRLTEEKDIPIALRAFKHVHDAYPHAGLIIAGDGPERRKLEGLARRLDIEGAVAFIGWQDDIVSLYKTANVFLLTSRYEGYGRTLVEAAALEVPIVSTNVGIAGSILEHNKHALICEVGDVECLASQMLRVLKDRTLTHQLRLATRNLILEDSHEEYLKKYGESISQCLVDRVS